MRYKHFIHFIQCILIALILHSVIRESTAETLNEGYISISSTASTKSQSNEDSYSIEVTNIPNYGAPKSKQYSGYLNVESNRGQLFHWFIEKESTASQNSQSNDEIPVVIWLNGGM